MTPGKKPRLDDPRSFAFLLIGTPLFVLIALLTKSWATGRNDTIAVGPLGAERCIDAIASICKDATFKDAGLGGDVGAFAVLTVITGFAAIGVALVFGGLVLANKAKLPPMIAAYVTYGAAAFSMLVFAVRAGGADEVSMSWGPLFGLGGIGTGWYLLRRMHKLLPARSAYKPFVPATTGPMFGESAPAAAPIAPVVAQVAPVVAQVAPVAAAPVAMATPAVAAAPVMSSVPANQPTKCPKCKGQVDYIAQYQRSWCARCRQYA